MGVFNTIFSKVTPLLVETFIDNKRQFRRKETVYDSVLGTEVTSEVTESFLSGPPTPFGKGEFGKNFGGTDNVVKIGDSSMVVTTAHYEEVGFDVEPTSNAQVFVTVEQQEYMILGVNPYDAGDGNVAMLLHLRR